LGHQNVRTLMTWELLGINQTVYRSSFCDALMHMLLHCHDAKNLDRYIRRHHRVYMLPRIDNSNSSCLPLFSLSQYKRLIMNHSASIFTHQVPEWAVSCSIPAFHDVIVRPLQIR
jgi:hypothetical protein